MARVVILALLLMATEPFERIVAVIDHHVITLLEVRKAARIEMVRGGALVATETEPPPDLLELVRVQLVQEALLVEEAQKSGLPPIAEHDVDRAFGIFAARFPTPQAFQQFLLRCSLNVDDIRDSLRRSLRAEQALDSRVRSRIEITTNDLAKFRAAHPDAFSWTNQRVLSEAKNEQLVVRTRGYLEELCERADVRVIGAFDTSSPLPSPCAMPRAAP